MDFFKNSSINLDLPIEKREVEQYFFTENFINNIYTSFEYIEKSKILCLCTPAIASFFCIKKVENQKYLNNYLIEDKFDDNYESTKNKDLQDVKIIVNENSLTNKDDDISNENKSVEKHLDQINNNSKISIEDVLCFDIDCRFNNLPNYFKYDMNDYEKVFFNINDENIELIFKNIFNESFQSKLSNIKLYNDLSNLIKDIEYIFFDPPFFQIKPYQLRICVDEITNKNYNKKILITYPKRESMSLISAFKEYGLIKTKMNVEYKFVCPSKWENYGLYSNFELGKIKHEKFYKTSNSKSNNNPNNNSISGSNTKFSKTKK